jgi:hypothetical protein
MKIGLSVLLMNLISSGNYGDVLQLLMVYLFIERRFRDDPSEPSAPPPQGLLIYAFHIYNKSAVSGFIYNWYSECNTGRLLIIFYFFFVLKRRKVVTTPEK